jgi:hypothetical protein
MKVKDIDNFKELLDKAERLTWGEWETDFVADMREQHTYYDDAMFISPMQLKVLRSIAGADETKVYLKDLA